MRVVNQREVGQPAIDITLTYTYGSSSEEGRRRGIGFAPPEFIADAIRRAVEDYPFLRGHITVHEVDASAWRAY